MRVFDFDSYKAYVNAALKAFPNQGRGQYQRLAEHLSTHSSLISQIFKGDRELSLEKACEVATYLGLTEIEIDYFLVLVEWERAGSKSLKKCIERRRATLLEKSKSLGTRLPKWRPLSEAAQAIYYSQWYYSAIYLLTDIAGCQTLDAISESLGITRGEARNAVDFLIAEGFMKEKQGRLTSGPSWIHAEPDSPHAIRHRINWRIKALEKITHPQPHEVSFTIAYTLSNADRFKLRKKIEEFVADVGKLVEPSTPEALMCLNIDFFDAATKRTP